MVRRYLFATLVANVRATGLKGYLVKLVCGGWGVVSRMVRRYVQ